MKPVLACLTIVLLCVPLLSSGERLYLRDGSILKGTVVSVHGDSVHFKTSFGSRISLARKDVFKIEFEDSMPPSVMTGAAAVAEPGSLHVLFDSRKLSSKIVVHRGREEAVCLRANTIEQTLLVDNEIQFTYLDSLTDKKIRKGADTIYKNTIELKDMRLSLPAGAHSLMLVVGSLGRSGEKQRFETEPLLQTLELNNMIIYPGKTSKLVVEVKNKRWGMGGSELRVRE